MIERVRSGMQIFELEISRWLMLHGWTKQLIMVMIIK